MKSFTASIGTLLVGSVRLTSVCVGDTPALLLGPLTVEPPFRSHGVGRALITRALEEARQQGHRLMLLVGDEPFYGRLGFKKIPRGRAAMPGPNQGSGQEQEQGQNGKHPPAGGKNNH